ncbi:MAG: hypothetical protein HYZ39_02080 [Mycolicibacterium cosmeticum]|nr:hypothetical protein [Mycolicibacterium cosmeticum]
MIVRFRVRTTLTRSQFLAGLTDFTADAADPSRLGAVSTVHLHRRTRNTAEVTERSTWIWERLRYDWSDPQHISVKTLDSNLFGGMSGYQYTLFRRADGATDVEVRIIREGGNLIGNIVSWALGRFGQKALRAAFVRSVQAIEHCARTAGERPG